MASPHRIVVFSGSLSYVVCKAIVTIDRAIAGLEWLVVVHSPRRSLRRLLRNQWKNVRRNGLRWIGYTMRELATRPPPPARRTVPGGTYTRTAIAAMPRVRVVDVPDINGENAQDLVRAFAPDLGLSLAAPILRPDVFTIPGLGTLNLHEGKLPEYRGMPPAFWELWNDEAAVGCTVHWIDASLDTGPVAAQAVVPRDRFSSLRSLQLLLDEAGVSLMSTAVGEALAGHRVALPQTGSGRTNRKPTLAQFAALQRRMRQIEPSPADRPLRRAAKHGVHAVVGGAARIGLCSALTPRVTVILYHRVSDAVRDNLTVGVAQFERQMALLRRHCHVLSIDEVVAIGAVPRFRRPLVCVTFDDGYLDNYRHAAPILERQGIPAAFFVATRIVGTERQFAHDVLRRNPPIPMMQWDHLRSMRDAGFTIGSHSATHIDCASEPEAVVVEELAQSRDDLERELGVAGPIFAYPYGGRQHMTPQRLELVKAAGYAGCLAAYGGSNVGRVDPWNVLRRGIHWQYSDRAFLHECLGL